jgi:hypothetical protein
MEDLVSNKGISEDKTVSCSGSLVVQHICDLLLLFLCIYIYNLLV